MPARVADVLEVVVFAPGTYAFLRGGRTRVVALLHPEKHVLELVHARVGEQQRRIVRRNQRGAANRSMPARGKVVEELLAYLVACHWGLPSFSHTGHEIGRASCRDRV